jgi:hypothetical protein
MPLNNLDINVNSNGVDVWLTDLKNIADSAINKASSSASSLQTNSFQTYPVSNSHLFPNSERVQIDSVSDPIEPTFDLPQRPVPRKITLNLSSVTPPHLDSVLVDPPTLNIPKAPGVSLGDAPVRNFNVNTNLSVPEFEGYNLPKVPTFESLKIPVLDTPNITPFLQAIPSFNSSVIPTSIVSFNPTRYTSGLVTSVRDLLLRRLSGGTGLSATVEAAIWDRDRDRELRASRLSEETLLNSRAGSGFSRPTGSMFSVLDNMVQDAQSKIIELSREIMIKQADLEQKNLDSSISQTMALEDLLLKEFLEFTKTSFDLAKYKKDTEVEIFKSSLSVFSSEIEMYKAYAISYETMIKAELNKLDIYKAELDGARLVNEVKAQEISVFSAGIEGIKASVDLYRSQIQAIEETLKIEGLKFDLFKSDIEAYNSTLESHKLKYNIYAEQIKGELSKTEIYDSQVKAYASRVQAYSSEADVSMKVAELNSNLEGLKLKQYEADTDLYIKQLQSDQLRYESAVNVYKGQADVFSAKLGLNRANAEIQLKNIENTIEQNKAQANISVENARLNLASLSNSANALIEGKKAAGGIYQAIGSSALSAINVSNHFSSSVGLTASEDHNYSGV